MMNMKEKNRKSSQSGLLLAVFLAFAHGASAVMLEGPEPYTKRLEYIQSDGTAYLDTGIRLATDMKVTMVFSETTAASSPTGIFGRRYNHSVNNFSFAANASNWIHLDFIGSEEGVGYDTYRAMTPAAVAVDTKYQAEISASVRRLTRVSDEEVVAVNDTLCPHVFIQPANGTAFIFALNGTDWRVARIRVYSLVIERNGEVIYDFIPCERDGQVQLYERIHGTYPEIRTVATSTSGISSGDPVVEATTGLTGGPVIADSTLPSVAPKDWSATIGVNVDDLGADKGPLDVYALYAPFAWCPTNPGTYFGMTKSLPYNVSGRIHTDLGFKLTQDMSADVIFSIESETMESRGRGISGYRSDASTQNFSVHFNGTGIFVDFNNSNYETYRATYGGGRVRTPYRAYFSKDRRALSDALTGQVLVQNTNACPDTIETVNNARLFDFPGMTAQSPINIYAVTIRENGAVIHDFRPAVVGGVTGLVDFVTQTMVKNAAETDYTAGAAVPTAVKGYEGIATNGSYTVGIPCGHVVPETTYHFGLIATGGATDKDYTTWGCEGPRRFTTKAPRGLMVIIR
jgi:hypothetical protein